METVQIEVYSFDELSEEAKDKAREWWRHGMDFAWRDDMEYQLSDECVDDLLIVNEYRFEESGKFWR